MRTETSDLLILVDAIKQLNDQLEDKDVYYLAVELLKVKAIRGVGSSVRSAIKDLEMNK